MNSPSEVAVTLTPELFEHLEAEAKRIGVPLEWLVASLVVDTLDSEPQLQPVMAA